MGFSTHVAARRGFRFKLFKIKHLTMNPSGTPPYPTGNLFRIASKWDFHNNGFVWVDGNLHGFSLEMNDVKCNFIPSIRN